MDKSLWHKRIKGVRIEQLRDGQQFEQAEIERIADYLDQRISKLRRAHAQDKSTSSMNEMVAGVLEVMRDSITERCLYQPLVWSDLKNIEYLANASQRDVLNEHYSAYFAKQIELNDHYKDSDGAAREEFFHISDKVARKRIYFEIDNAVAACISVPDKAVMSV